MEACTVGGKAPLQETLLVDSATKGIANVAVFVRKASRVHESAQGAGEDVPFDQKQCVFLTHVFPLVLGDTMKIMNSDPVGHNTKIDGKNSFNQTIPVGESIAFKPQKEEASPVDVRCSIHPWMLAYFLPRDEWLLRRDRGRRNLRDSESAGRRRVGIPGLARESRRTEPIVGVDHCPRQGVKMVEQRTVQIETGRRRDQELNALGSPHLRRWRFISRPAVGLAGASRGCDRGQSRNNNV